jgi:hypothetical protein
MSLPGCRRRTVLFLALCGSLAGPAARAESPVRFGTEVMAVLSRAGCNQGTCHGALNGKNGFKLSLRGEDPAFDYAALTRDTLGRRANPLRPAESLLLRKATTLTPHEGGKRFGVDSTEYRILRDWIAAGLPADSADAPQLQALDLLPAGPLFIEPQERITLRVQATFADGLRRDVTRLAVFEPANPLVRVSADGVLTRSPEASPGVTETAVLVRYLDRQATLQVAFVPPGPFTWPDMPEANFVDQHIFAKLRALRLAPSELCSDSVYLRRVYLDLLGILPTATEARAFLADARPDKRARLVDALLERPEFADWWALKWSDLLRNEEKTLDRKGVLAFHHWLRQSILHGQPLNDMARDLIAARGSTYSAPPANFYRALRDPQVRAEAVAQVFLGVRLQCARCHNHPFDRWTQTDYHSLAAFFARVQYRIVENNRKDRLDSHEFDGEQIVWMDRVGEVLHPRTGEPLPPRFPAGGLAGDGDRLQQLADWVARPDNPFFARTQANRIWLHLMGRGLVEPNDDFRASNPAVNAPLLDALAADLAAHRFDLRHTIRTIVQSRTYQLAATPNDTNREDETNFSHALIRPLPAEPLLDSLSQVLEVPVAFNGYPLGMRAGQLAGVRAFRDRELPPTVGERFLKAFGKPDRLLSCECERSDDTTLTRAFQLITGELINDMLADSHNRIHRLLAAGRSNEQIVEEFYLAALSRPPTGSERQAVAAILDRASDRRTAVEDFVWGLVNSKQFLLRQ